MPDEYVHWLRSGRILHSDASCPDLQREIAKLVRAAARGDTERLGDLRMYNLGDASDPANVGVEYPPDRLSPCRKCHGRDD